MCEVTLELSREIDVLLIEFINNPSETIKQKIELKRKELHRLIDQFFGIQADVENVLKTA